MSLLRRASLHSATACQPIGTEASGILWYSIDWVVTGAGSSQARCSRLISPGRFVDGGINLLYQ